MIAFGRLPLNIFTIIFYAAKNDKQLLAQLALTCRPFRALAEFFLYSHVAVAGHHLRSFAATVRQNSRLARLVRSYTGPTHPGIILHTLFDEDWVETLVNIQSLDISIPRAAKFKIPKIPVGVECLTLRGVYEPPALERLLVHLGNLRYLKLRNFYRRLYYSPFTPLACPNLKILDGGLEAAAALLPGREIARFDWFYCGDEWLDPPDDLIQHLAPELANIHSLSYRDDVSEDIVMLYILPDFLHLTMHSLYFLEVAIIHPEDWDYIPFLSQLRVLLVLESPLSWTAIQVIEDGDSIVDLFHKCRSLERVDVGGRDHLTSLTCKRWTRGTIEPYDVPLHVVELDRMEFIDG